MLIEAVSELVAKLDNYTGKYAVVAQYPDCDVCKFVAAKLSPPNANAPIAKARFDAKTKLAGMWMFLCEEHFAKVGAEIGTGLGQVLETIEDRRARKSAPVRT